jgi:outer membrane protein OmpA-like peptidoglycan-associated protein
MNAVVKRILFFVIAVFVFMFNETLFAQKICDDRMEIFGPQAYVSDNYLYIDMDINYFELSIGSRESIRITPVIRGDTGRLCFPPVIINGSEQHKIYQRSVAFNERKKENDACYDKEPLAVIDIEQAPVKSYRYKAALPLSDEIANGSLWIETRVNSKGKKSKTYEDRLIVSFRFEKKAERDLSPDVDRQLLSWVQILPVSLNEKETENLRGIISLKDDDLFKEGSEKERNHAIYEKLLEEVRNLRKIDGPVITGIDVTGYGTPIGDAKKNERDALMRALALKEYLYESGIAANAVLSVWWVAEDWETVAKLVQQSEMPLKTAVLDIIRNVEIAQGREKELKNLSHGYPYEYLRSEIFPRVRRVEYTIAYYVPDKAKERTLRFKNREFRLSDFFTLADFYPKGSSEFNDLYDLAARIFTDSPEAHINAAAVALTKRDTVKARKYIEPYITLPEAACNVGILYYLEGNTEKAEVYLEMAKSLGVSQAGEILESLHKQR